MAVHETHMLTEDGTTLLIETEWGVEIAQAVAPTFQSFRSVYVRSGSIPALIQTLKSIGNEEV